MKNSTLAWILFVAAIALMLFAEPLGLVGTEPEDGMIAIPHPRTDTGYLSPLFILLEAALLGAAFYLKRKNKENNLLN